jgi:hypothetical protein
VGIKQHFRAKCRAIWNLVRKETRYRWQRFRIGKDETSPISEDEHVLRRIHRNHYDSSLSPPVKRPAFEPSSQDIDGLSVHREMFITAKKLAWCGRSPGNYYVARFSVRELANDPAKLTVVAASDIDQPPGHAVIPQLSTGSKTKPIQLRLAKLSADRTVYRPPSKREEATHPKMERLD